MDDINLGEDEDGKRLTVKKITTENFRSKQDE